MRPRLFTGLVVVCSLVPGEEVAAPQTPDAAFELVIAGGRVLDPESGLDAVRHVGIRDGRIHAVTERPLAGASRIDARGRVVAPGFIDLNTYQHGEPLFRLRAADGVTSVLNLEDGATDVDAYYRALEDRALIHYGAAVDHESVRHVAAGDTTLEVIEGVNEARGVPTIDTRALSEAESERLMWLVSDGLDEGAVAVGLGLEYSPGATHTEILNLAQLALAHGAPIHVHVRDFHETRDWDQLYEVFGLATVTGAAVHVKHLQSSFESYTAEALSFVDRARSVGLGITAECYPYTAASTFIESATFDDWESWPDAAFARYEWPETGERLTRDTFARYRRRGGVVIIYSRDEASQERAVRDCLAHPVTMVASDGAWDDGRTHPRVAGTNSRVLGRYVRDEGVLSLMGAVEKMTLAPARHLEPRVPSMKNKGRLSVGADADVVVFDPETVIDRATYRDPLRAPHGIDAVIVSGVPVVRGGVVVDEVFPGRAIRAERESPPARESRDD